MRLPLFHSFRSLRWRLAGFLGLYFLAWIALPAMLASSFPLDVVESLSWGREWQWGYYKHPPLPAWAVHAFFKLFGEAGPYLLSQLCIAATLWLVWDLGQRIMDRQRAILGTFLLFGIYYYTWPTIEFNHNVAQMPLWAAIVHRFFLALHSGRWRDWALAGLLAGLGMLTKYSVAVLLICLFAFLCLPQHRRWLRQPGPWLALLVMLAVWSPNLAWLVQNDWLPFTYAHARAHAAGAANPRINAIKFLLVQWLNHLPMLLIVLAAGVASHWRRTAQATPAADPQPRLHTSHGLFLLWMALGPGLLTTLLGLALGMGLRDMWGAPMWNFSGLLLAALLPASVLHSRFHRMLRNTAIWMVLCTAGMAFYLSHAAQLRSHPVRTDWPAHALAQQAEQSWNAVSTCPLDTVAAANYWLAGVVADHASAFPSVLIGGDPRYSPWITRQRLLQRGALQVWREADIDEWRKHDWTLTLKNWFDPHPPPPRLRQGQSPRLPAPEPPRAPAPLSELDESAFIVTQGEWSLSWPGNPDQEPLVVHWRAWTPPGCARRWP